MEFSVNKPWSHIEWLSELETVNNLPPSKEKKDKGRLLRRAIFQANVNIVRDGYYTTFHGKKVYLPSVKCYSRFYSCPILLQTFSRDRDKTIIEIVNKDSIDAAEDLIECGYNPAVLNMASEDGPGGGVIGGCYGQEESLFRRSNLYVHMYPYCPHAAEYGLNRSSDCYPLDKRFGGVYVHNALVFRKKEKDGYELMDSCVPLSFIAVPAIRDPELTTERTLCTLDREIALDKIRQILKIGIENNHDSLVLGAWGCGIFHNPPEDIAKLFKQVLNEPGIKDYYKIVRFAIIEDSCSFNVHNPSGNFIPFKMIFDNVRE